MVNLYLDNSELVFEEENLYTVGPVLVNPARVKHFTNALHDSYDEQDLKDLEYDVADALDETGLGWVRNPVNGGYSIPFLHKGDSRRFFSDFLVWRDDMVFAVAPKGRHLQGRRMKRAGGI